MRPYPRPPERTDSQKLCQDISQNPAQENDMKLLPRFLLMVVLIITGLGCGKSAKAPAPGGVRLAGLRCESLDDPLGVDTPRPRLSWAMEAAGRAPAARGQRQTAYR